MYKKLLSNLPFQPSLVSDVAFYARRIRSESSVRKLGLVFIALAMVVQMFAVASPPEPTLAESSNDVIRGGFSSRDEATLHCLGDTQGFRDVLAYYGVSCDILSKAQTVTISSTDYGKQLDSMGRNPQPANNPKNGKPSDQYAVQIGGTTFYMKNMWYWDTWSSSEYKVLKMNNKYGDTIFIMYSCGNIVTIDKYTPPTPEPEPTPENEPPASTFTATCSGIAWKATDPQGSPTVRIYITVKTDYANSDWTFKGGAAYTIEGSATGTSNNGQKRIPPIIAEDTENTFRVFVTASDVKLDGSQGEEVRAKPINGVVFGPCSEEEPAPPEPETPTTVTTPSIPDACPNIPGDQTSSDECYPCPEAEDGGEEACIDFNKTARNKTQNIADANGTVAMAGDVIEYTLRVTNTGSTEFKDFRVEENLNDVLEYAKVVNLYGGTLGDDGIVRWPDADIASGEVLAKNITVQVKDTIPQTPASTSDPASHDLTMTNVFYGKSVHIELPAAPHKQIETVTTTLPNTGPGETLAVGFVIATFAGYLFARSKLMGEELTIVKEEYSSGASV